MDSLAWGGLLHIKDISVVVLVFHLSDLGFHGTPLASARHETFLQLKALNCINTFLAEHYFRAFYRI
jgi:hypothetical protein